MANNSRNQKEEKHYVRIMGTDIEGNKNLLYGLTKIKGVGFSFSNALCVSLKLDKNKKIESLTEKELEKIENFLQDPKGLPSWLYNKRKDLTTGEDKHFVTKELDYDLMQVKRRLAKIKSYRGIRLRLGLPVRGQRTRSNFKRTRNKKVSKN